MKKLSFKTKILSLALVAGVTATAGALTLNGYEKEVLAENTAVFQMENSVRLRLNGNGLAFSAKLDAAKYEEINNDQNKTLYFIVMPAKYLDNVKTENGYDYAKAIVRGENGVYDYNASHCLYVDATGAIYKNGEDYYALGGVSDVLEENRKLDFTAVACVETKTENGEYTYEYAAYPDGKTQMPAVSQYTTLSKSVLYATTDYSAQIAQHYAWFGKGVYALTIATTEDYNALVGKINGGATLGDMELRINSGVDKTQATLNEGMALPATQTTYSTVKFYDDDGTTLLTSADVNEGENVTLPTTPAKAATEDYTYTFEKWVTEKNGDVEATLENITENMSVYAKYTAVKNKITITWKKNAADQGTTEIYKRGETPQYKGETLKNYFEGDKYYICKGFENIVPAEEDTTYVCSWEEHAGKEIGLTSWRGAGANWFKTDMAKDTNEDVTISFNATSSVSGNISFSVLAHHSGDLNVLAFRVEYQAQDDEIITFNDSTAKYYDKYLGIPDGMQLIYKNKQWCFFENTALAYWCNGTFFTTGIAKDANADVTIAFNATSSVSENISCSVLVHHPGALEVLAFRIDYQAQEGEIITFNNSGAIYSDKYIHIVDGTQLIYKNGQWYVVKTVAITGLWFDNWMNTDIAKGNLTPSSDERLTFSATSTVHDDVSFQVLAHHPDGREFVAFRIDYGTSEDSSHSYALTEGEIITFDNAIATYRGGVIRLNMKLIYKNGAWAVYNG